MDPFRIVMRKFVDVLEDDAWKVYIYMQCPDPETHEMTGCCPDCENKYIELEGIKNRVDICRLSQTCKSLRSIVDENLVEI